MTSQKGKISLLLILLGIIILGGYLAYQSFSPWKIYLNPYLGFAFLYPKQWQVNTFQYSKDPNRGITLGTGPKDKLDREVFNLYDSNPPLYINCHEDPKLQTKAVQLGNEQATVGYVLANNYQYGCIIPKVRTLTGREFWVEFKFLNKERENMALEVLKTIRGLKIISYSTTSDVTANWETYNNEVLKLSFRYPGIYKLEKEDHQRVTFSGTFGPENQIIPSELTLSFKKTVDLNSLKNCSNADLESDIITTCIDGIVETKKFNGIQMNFFTIRTGSEKTQASSKYIVQTVTKPEIEFAHLVLGGGVSTRVNEILSTFRFLKEESNKLRVCPDIWSEFLSPIQILNNPYYGQKGQFITINDSLDLIPAEKFDLEWIRKNCEVSKPEPVG